jgi:DnaJ-class molecular chaperone
MARTKKPRPSIFDKDYAPYGRAKPGNSDEWRSNYEQRMYGHDEAVQILGEDNPYAVLGLRQGATKDEVKSAYRKIVASECREAFGLNPDPAQVERFKKVHAAYSEIGR